MQKNERHCPVQVERIYAEDICTGNSALKINVIQLTPASDITNNFWCHYLIRK